LEFLDESQQTTLVSQVDPNLVFHSSLPIGSGHRGFVCCGWDALRSPTPAAAPPASPSAATSKESHDEEQQYRTDGGVDDCADQSSTKMDAQLRQQPTSDKGTQNPDNEVANDPEAGALHDLTCQPACNETHKQNDQQAFTRHIHVPPRHFGSDPALQADLLLSVQI
jgi:hypothetical protein